MAFCVSTEELLWVITGCASETSARTWAAANGGQRGALRRVENLGRVFGDLQAWVEQDACARPEHPLRPPFVDGVTRVLDLYRTELVSVESRVREEKKDFKLRSLVLFEPHLRAWEHVLPPLYQFVSWAFEVPSKNSTEIIGKLDEEARSASFHAGPAHLRLAFTTLLGACYRLMRLWIEVWIAHGSKALDSPASEVFFIDKHTHLRPKNIPVAVMSQQTAESILFIGSVREDLANNVPDRCYDDQNELSQFMGELKIMESCPLDCYEQVELAVTGMKTLFGRRLATSLDREKWHEALSKIRNQALMGDTRFWGDVTQKLESKIFLAPLDPRDRHPAALASFLNWAWSDDDAFAENEEADVSPGIEFILAVGELSPEPGPLAEVGNGWERLRLNAKVIKWPICKVFTTMTLNRYASILPVLFFSSRARAQVNGAWAKLVQHAHQEWSYSRKLSLPFLVLRRMQSFINRLSEYFQRDVIESAFVVFLKEIDLGICQDFNAIVEYHDRFLTSIERGMMLKDANDALQALAVVLRTIAEFTAACRAAKEVAFRTPELAHRFDAAVQLFTNSVSNSRLKSQTLEQLLV